MFTKGTLILVFKVWTRSFEVGVYLYKIGKSHYYIPVGIDTEYYLNNKLKKRTGNNSKKFFWKITEDNLEVDLEKLKLIRENLKQIKNENFNYRKLSKISKKNLS